MRPCIAGFVLAGDDLTVARLGCAGITSRLQRRRQAKLELGRLRIPVSQLAQPAGRRLLGSRSSHQVRQRHHQRPTRLGPLPLDGSVHGCHGRLGTPRPGEGPRELDLERDRFGLALDNIRAGAEEADRNFDDLKLYMRVACAVSDDRERARKEVEGYASIAANTVYRTVPRDYFDDQLYDELGRLMSEYNYAEHGSNTSRHRQFLTDRILDAIAVACTPDEAVTRFRELIELGIDGFVWPANMPDPHPYIETFAERVIPNVT